MTDSAPRIAFYIPSFERGGVERLIINLSTELVQRGVDVAVLVRETDPPIKQLPDEATVVRLGSLQWLNRPIRRLLPPHVANAILSLPSYVRYLRRQQPELLISMQTSPFALLGVLLAGTGTTIAVRESNTPSVATATPTHRIGRFATLAKRLAYPRADHVIAVSEDAADDLVDHIGLSPEMVRVIYNPTYNDTIVERASEPVEHPWFDEDAPVVLSVGRFSNQKDFETLLTAFARLSDSQSARLVLVGDGQHRERLETLVDDLGIEDNTAFLGYQQNPYKFMAKSDIFVLSSHYEGLPNVLIEALGVGTPVISTDCPSGPREILLDGTGGQLVPVGDADGMATALERYLDDPAYAESQLAAAREGLDRFTPAQAAAAYLELAE